MKKYHVYIMANQRNTTLYVGVSGNFVNRVYEHKSKSVPGFTAKYNIDKLVYYEEYDDVLYAINREKQLKGWLRKRKIDLIESVNKDWDDLSEDWY